MRTLFRKALVLLAAVCVATAVWLMMNRRAELPPPSQQLLEASAALDEIIIDAQLDAEHDRLSVRQTLILQNRTGETLNAAVLRTWPNAYQSVDTSPCMQAGEEAYPNGFSAGALIMARAEVNGASVYYRYTDAAKTVLAVPVPGGWEPGASAEIALEYTLQVPRMKNRFGVWDGVYALGNAFAIPSVWEDGAFRTDSYEPVGDPFVSDCANYTVRVSVPADYICAGSGHPQVKNQSREKVYTFSALAVRDFALVITNRLKSAERLHNGVLVTAWASTGREAQQMVRYACRALESFEKRWGKYPYQSYTLSQVHFPCGGMEYPAFSMIGSGLEKREMEYAVAHETAHQWWYALVGSDSWHQPWQDEALCEFALLEYAGDVYGMGEREDLERSRVESAMRVTVPQGMTPGAPLSAFDSMSNYSLVVYNRGAAYVCALDRLLGGADAFLRDYARNYAFGRATRADFEMQLTLSTGEDLASLTRDYLDTSLLH